MLSFLYVHTISSIIFVVTCYKSIQAISVLVIYFLQIFSGVAIVLNGRKTTPNAVAVLFRVFLETSLDKYILVARLDLHKRPKIKEKINSVTKHMTKIKIASNYQLLRVRAISADAYTDILNIQWFHQYVHSSTMLPESDALKAKWDNLQEFFEILWEFINKTSR